MAEPVEIRRAIEPGVGERLGWLDRTFSVRVRNSGRLSIDGALSVLEKGSLDAGRTGLDTLNPILKLGEQARLSSTTQEPQDEYKDRYGPGENFDEVACEL